MPESRGSLEGATIEYRADAPENRAETMDRLDYKVEAVLGLQRKVDGLTNEFEPAVIGPALDRAGQRSEVCSRPRLSLGTTNLLNYRNNRSAPTAESILFSTITTKQMKSYGAISGW